MAVDHHDLLHDDAALDRAVAGLGFAAASVPETPASAILERAAFYTPAAAAGVAVWKVTALVLLGTCVGVGVGYGIWGRGSRHDQALGALEEEEIGACETAIEAALAAAQATSATLPAVTDRAAADAQTESTAPPRTGARRTSPPRARGGAAERAAVSEPLPPGYEQADEHPVDSGPPPDEFALFSPEELLDDAPTAVEPIAIQPTTVEGTWTPAPRRAAGGTHLRVTGHLGLALGQWSHVGPPAGAGVRVGLHHVGFSRKPVHPTLGAHLDLVLLPGAGDDESRLLLGAQATPGAAFCGTTACLELGWAVGMRTLPPTPSATDIDDAGAGWLFLATGPEVGLTTLPRGGRPAFHVGLAIQGSVLDLQQTGTSTFLPWVGLNAGVQLPALRRADDRDQP